MEKLDMDNKDNSYEVSQSSAKPLRKPRPSLSAVKRLQRWFSPQKAWAELCDPLFWHDVIIETVLCIYFNALVVWVGISLIDSIYQPNVLHFGLFAGFFAFLCIEGWGPICGSSINPARTFAVFLIGRFTPIRALVYCIVEVGGGAAGAMLAKALTPEIFHDRFKPILPAEGMTPFMACCMEAILTSNHIIVGLVVSDPKLKTPSVMGSFPVGFTMATGIMGAGTHTGGLQNPVVSLVYAMTSGDYTAHWMYWVGSLVGASVASAFYVAMEQIRDRYGPYIKEKEEPEIDKRDSDIIISNSEKEGPRRRGGTTSPP